MRIDDPDNLPEYTCHLCKETLRGSEFYVQNRTRKWKTSKGVPKEASYWWMTSRCKDCTRAVQAEISRKNYAPIKEEAKFKKGIKNLFPQVVKLGVRNVNTVSIPILLSMKMLKEL